MFFFVSVFRLAIGLICFCRLRKLKKIKEPLLDLFDMNSFATRKNFLVQFDVSHRISRVTVPSLCLLLSNVLYFLQK